MKSLKLLTIGIVLMAIGGCLSVKSGGSGAQGPQGPQGPSSTTEKVIVVPENK